MISWLMPPPSSVWILARNLPNNKNSYLKSANDKGWTKQIKELKLARFIFPVLFFSFVEI